MLLIGLKTSADQFNHSKLQKSQLWTNSIPSCPQSNNPQNQPNKSFPGKKYWKPKYSSFLKIKNF